MEETENDDEKEYSEKHGEDVRITARQQYKSNEGGDSSIEDGGPHIYHRGRRSLLPAAGDGEEGVADVDAVVDAEADCDDDVDGADHVDGDVPGRHEAADVDEAEGDGGEDEDGAEDVGQEDEGREEDAGEGEAEVPEELSRDDLVSLPVCILLNF